MHCNAWLTTVEEQPDVTITVLSELVIKNELKQILNRKHELDLSAFGQGVYYVSVTEGDKVFGENVVLFK